MKLLVEMTDAEYEEYRKYAKGDYIEPDNISIEDFLERRGYRLISSKGTKAKETKTYRHRYFQNELIKIITNRETANQGEGK